MDLLKEMAAQANRLPKPALQAKSEQGISRASALQVKYVDGKTINTFRMDGDVAGTWPILVITGDEPYGAYVAPDSTMTRMPRHVRTFLNTGVRFGSFSPTLGLSVKLPLAPHTEDDARALALFNWIKSELFRVDEQLEYAEGERKVGPNKLVALASKGAWAVLNSYVDSNGTAMDAKAAASFAQEDEWKDLKTALTASDSSLAINVTALTDATTVPRATDILTSHDKSRGFLLTQIELDRFESDLNGGSAYRDLSPATDELARSVLSGIFSGQVVRFTQRRLQALIMSTGKEGRVTSFYAAPKVNGVQPTGLNAFIKPVTSSVSTTSVIWRQARSVTEMRNRIKYGETLASRLRFARALTGGFTPDIGDSPYPNVLTHMMTPHNGIAYVLANAAQFTSGTSVQDAKALPTIGQAGQYINALAAYLTSGRSAVFGFTDDMIVHHASLTLTTCFGWLATRSLLARCCFADSVEDDVGNNLAAQVDISVAKKMASLGIPAKLLGHALELTPRFVPLWNDPQYVALEVPNGVISTARAESTVYSVTAFGKYARRDDVASKMDAGQKRDAEALTGPTGVGGYVAYNFGGMRRQHITGPDSFGGVISRDDVNSWILTGKQTEASDALMDVFKYKIKQSRTGFVTFYTTVAGALSANQGGHMLSALLLCAFTSGNAGNMDRDPPGRKSDRNARAKEQLPVPPTISKLNVPTNKLSIIPSQSHTGAHALIAFAGPRSAADNGLNYDVRNALSPPVIESTFTLSGAAEEALFANHFLKTAGALQALNRADSSVINGLYELGSFDLAFAAAQFEFDPNPAAEISDAIGNYDLPSPHRAASLRLHNGVNVDLRPVNSVRAMLLDDIHIAARGLPANVVTDNTSYYGFGLQRGSGNVSMLAIKPPGIQLLEEDDNAVGTGRRFHTLGFANAPQYFPPGVDSIDYVKCAMGGPSPIAVQNQSIYAGVEMYDVICDRNEEYAPQVQTMVDKIRQVISDATVTLEHNEEGLVTDISYSQTPAEAGPLVFSSAGVNVRGRISYGMLSGSPKNTVIFHSTTEAAQSLLFDACSLLDIIAPVGPSPRMLADWWLGRPRLGSPPFPTLNPVWLPASDDFSQSLTHNILAKMIVGMPNLTRVQPLVPRPLGKPYNFKLGETV